MVTFCDTLSKLCDTSTVLCVILMETDRTGEMIRCCYNSTLCTLQGLLALGIFSGGIFVLHDVLLPDGRFTGRDIEDTRKVSEYHEEYSDRLQKVLGVLG